MWEERKAERGRVREIRGLVCMSMRACACIHNCTSGNPKSKVPQWPYLAPRNILTLSLPPSLCVCLCAWVCLSACVSYSSCFFHYAVFKHERALWDKRELREGIKQSHIHPQSSTNTHAGTHQRAYTYTISDTRAHMETQKCNTPPTLLWLIKVN